MLTSSVVLLTAAGLVAANPQVMPWLNPDFTADFDSLNAAQSSAIARDIWAYASSLLNSDPQASSKLGVLATAIPAECVPGGPSPVIPDSCYATATPVWFANLPADVKSFAGSVMSAEASIVQADINKYAAPGATTAAGPSSTAAAVNNGAVTPTATAASNAAIVTSAINSVSSAANVIVSSASAAAVTTSASHAGAARPTGVAVAGLVGAVGAFAVALL